ncbi:MAG TPA: ferritin-like domain-containing protein [Bryobacteraceae bacterium]|nr:ferritin-like domain-containing protein [Bryobacteraceae bacterium]
MGAALTPDPKKPFLSDIQEIRRRARMHMERGAVTENYKADLETSLRLLNEALATEIVCVLRYKRHHYMASGIHAQAVAQEFLEHANEEQGHADKIAERIIQLNGAPNFSPEGLLMRSHSEYVEGQTLAEMIQEDLVAERIAIDCYSEIIRYFGDKDPTSRRLMEEILAKEEEHAEDMRTLVERIGKDAQQPERI